MKKICHSPRLPFLLIALAGFGFGFGAIGLSALFKIPACPLCIIQRMLHLLLGALAVGGLLLAGNVWLRRLFAVLLAAGSTAGIVTAGYQTWLQRFAADVSCAAEEPWWEKLANWAGKELPSMFKVSGFCADASFKIFGLSLAEWSLLGFVFLLLVALFALCGKFSARGGLCPFSRAK